MTTMSLARLAVCLVGCAALPGVSACVSDPPVEDTVPSQPGLTQPDGAAGAALTAAVACEKLKTARKGAADKLGCDAPADQCPNFLFLGGSVPCDQYAEGSVNACVAAIGDYRACSDFSDKPCAVSAVRSSCKKPVPPEAGKPVHDGATVRPKEAGVPPKAKDAASRD